MLFTQLGDYKGPSRLGQIRGSVRVLLYHGHVRDCVRVDWEAELDLDRPKMMSLQAVMLEIRKTSKQVIRPTIEE